MAARPPIGPTPGRGPMRGPAAAGEARLGDLTPVAPPAGTGPGGAEAGILLLESGCEPGMPGFGLCAAPCRDNIISFILFCISEVKLLARGGGGPGLRAALTGPSGDEVEFMVGAGSFAGDRSEGGLGDVSGAST